jgi:hypothetical protein
MSNILKALLTIAFSIVGSTVAFLVYSDLLFTWLPLPSLPMDMAIIAGATCGLLYGLESGLLLRYYLSRPSGWFLLICDLTWSYPNTLFGLVLGNLFYPFFGSLSRELSEGQSWVAYAKSQGDTKQTLGTINLGGEGPHERLHLLQARLFGPFFLPVFVSAYVVTAALQVLWTVSVGLMLYLAKRREMPYLRPPMTFPLQGFFGWISYATPFELWAHARHTSVTRDEISMFSTPYSS